MTVIKRIINITIAILAIAACFQVVKKNDIKLLSFFTNGHDDYRPRIVSTIQNEKSKFNGQLMNKSISPRS